MRNFFGALVGVILVIIMFPVIAGLDLVVGKLFSKPDGYLGMLRWLEWALAQLTSSHLDAHQQHQVIALWAVLIAAYLLWGGIAMVLRPILKK